MLALILSNSGNPWTIVLIVSLVSVIQEGWRILVIGVLSIATSIAMSTFAPDAISNFFRQVVP